MELRKLTDLACQNKTVFIRQDPCEAFLDPTRATSDLESFKTSLDSIKYLLEQGCKVVIGSNYGTSVGSFDERFSLESYGYFLSNVFGKEVIFIEDYHRMPIENVIKQINNNQIILLENLTFHRGEIENDSGFLDNISSGIDFYVNDSFSSVEQTYASVVGFAAKLPMFARGAGLELAREFEILRKMKSNPMAPFSAIIDASDIGHIAPIMMSLYTNCNYILLTGPVALTVSLVLSGHSRQGYETEERMIREIISSANSWRVQLLLPKDFKGSINGKKGTYNLNEITAHLDSFEMIEPGVETLVEYQKVLGRSKTVFHMSVPCVANASRFSEENFSWLASLLSGLDANVVINNPNMTNIIGSTDSSQSNLFLCQGYKASNKYIEGKALPGLDVIMQ